MKKENIKISQKADTWQDAIGEVVGLLIQAGSCTEGYTDEIIDTVNEFGPYIVLTPGIALAHSRPSKAVLKADMALVVYKEPVVFGHSTNDPVDMVFSFCSPNSTDHIEHITEFAEILSDENTVQNIRKAGTIEEIYKELKMV